MLDQGRRNIFQLGEDRFFRTLPSIPLQLPCLSMQFNVVCVEGLKNYKLDAQIRKLIFKVQKDFQKIIAPCNLS